MIIEQRMPFDHCEKCPEFVLNVNNTTYYADGGILTRAITVSCKHEWLCTQIAERVKKENATEDSMCEDL